MSVPLEYRQPAFYYLDEVIRIVIAVPGAFGRPCYRLSASAPGKYFIILQDGRFLVQATVGMPVGLLSSKTRKHPQSAAHAYEQPSLSSKIAFSKPVSLEASPHAKLRSRMQAKLAGPGGSADICGAFFLYIWRIQGNLVKVYSWRGLRVLVS